MKFKDGIRVLICATLIMSMWSCKKDDGGASTPENDKYLTCKIDGEYREFNAKVNANDKPSEEVVHFVVVGGHENDDPLSPGLGLELLVEDGGATTTHYTSKESNLHGVYYEQTENGTLSYDNGSDDGTGFELTITRLDDWGVAGTFSGVLRLGAEGEYIKITEGKFSAPYNGNE
ncbi:hypothetical protein GCM10023231_19030 [Olivibacter ginsenosidimutans]|uniref:Uncharacterized protein n=2 Tax=Olivibacter ginsenosidimutans TaxID=1176537 RepID=A0ABP9B929_9SPHI